MPRKAGSKNKSTGSRFKPYEGRYPDDRHVRLTKDMLMDTAYMKLSPSAKVLYQYMKLWSAGKPTVIFAMSLMNNVMSKPTFTKARDELKEKGFIKYPNSHNAKYLRETAEYEFSTEWREQK